MKRSFKRSVALFLYEDCLWRVMDWLSEPMFWPLLLETSLVALTVMKCCLSTCQSRSVGIVLYFLLVMLWFVVSRGLILWLLRRINYALFFWLYRREEEEEFVSFSFEEEEERTEMWCLPVELDFPRLH